MLADIDRERAEKLGVIPHDGFDAMQAYVGSACIDDFNYPGRADGADRAVVRLQEVTIG